MSCRMSGRSNFPLNILFLDLSLCFKRKILSVQFEIKKKEKDYKYYSTIKEGDVFKTDLGPLIQ